MKIIG